MWIFSINCKMSLVEHKRDRKSKASFYSMISSRTKLFCFVSILFFPKMLPSSAVVIINTNNTTLINENSTLYFPMENHSNSTNEDFNDPRRNDNKAIWCECANKFEENENEHQCHCGGPKLLKIPQNLENITRLSITNAKFKVSSWVVGFCVTFSLIFCRYYERLDWESIRWP